jgi:hypothetical protein
MIHHWVKQARNLYNIWFRNQTTCEIYEYIGEEIMLKHILMYSGVRAFGLLGMESHGRLNWAQ